VREFPFARRFSRRSALRWGVGGVAGLMVGSILTACGSSSAPASSTAASSSAAPTTTGSSTAPTAAPASTPASAAAAPTPAAQTSTATNGQLVKLVWYQHQYDPTDNVYRKTVFPAIQKQFGVTFDFQVQRDADYRAKVLPQIATGGGPDIFELGEDFRYKFSQAGILAPIDYSPWGSQQKYADFWSTGIAKALQVNGKDYALPTGWGAFPENYFVRQDDAVAGGIPASDIEKYQKTPITWQDLPEWTAKMTVKDSQGRITRDGFMIQHGYGAARTYVFFKEHFLELGGKVLSDDGKTSLINSDQGIAVMQYLYDLVFKYQSSMLRPQSNESGSGVLPKNGTASTIGLGAWAYPTFQSLDPKNWQTTRNLLTPQVDPTKPLYLTGPGWNHAVNAHSQQISLGFKILQHIWSTYGSTFADAGAFVPIKDWMTTYPAVKKLPDSDAWVKLATDATVYVPPPAELLSETVRTTGFQTAFEAVMFNKSNIKQEMDKLNKDIQDALAGN